MFGDACDEAMLHVDDIFGAECGDQCPVSSSGQVVTYTIYNTLDTAPHYTGSHGTELPAKGSW